jgi:hypothetical protein
MVLYTCFTCNKEFKKKCNYAYHIENKKKPCNSITKKSPPISSGFPPISSEFAEEFAEENIESNNIIDILIKKPSSNDANKCIYCNKFFTRIDNLQRHLNERCKSKETYDELERLKEDMKIIIQNYQKLENNYQNLENANENLKKEIGVIKVNQQGIENPKTVNKTVNNNNNTNKQINKGVILNNTVNIQVVQFGNEDIDKLDLADAMKSYLKSTGGNIASNMLKFINLNKDYPENNNICITDLSREIVKIHNGEKFVYKKFKNVKDEILNKIVKNTRKIVLNYENSQKLKKSNDTKNKLKINETSLKLIEGISAEDIVREEIRENEKNLKKKNKENKLLKIKELKHLENIAKEKGEINTHLYSVSESDSELNLYFSSESESESEEERDFTLEERLRIEHLERKRDGMQKKTLENIKEGLYNAKGLF